MLIDLAIDFGRMRCIVGPGIGQIFCSECWIGHKQIGFTAPQSFGMHQQPYWDPCSDDTGVTVEYTWRAFDSRRPPA